MISSSYPPPADPAVASEDEVTRLSDFLTPYLNRRPFCKGVGRFHHAVFPDRPKPVTPKQIFQATRKPAFHFLKAEFEEKLGPQEGDLVQRVWAEHNLGHFESRINELRPALRRLFTCAARLAAVKDAGTSLKAVLQTFERHYFPVNDIILPPTPPPKDQRLSLLALIKSGEGAHLLESVLTTEGKTEIRPHRSNPSPSVSIEQDTIQLRREFLLDTAVRAGDWAQAYRQGRLLQLADPHRPIPYRSSRQFQQTCRELLLCGGQPPSKQKQLLIDLASTESVPRYEREELALKASGSTTQTCRPGELELLLCQFLDSNDPRWQVFMRRLFRYRALPHAWISTVRKLWHRDPNRRYHCRLLFALLRHSRERADRAWQEAGRSGSALQHAPGQTLGRLNRALEMVRAWNALLGQPEVEQARRQNGYPFELPASLHQHLLEVCRHLGECPPKLVRMVPRLEQVGVQGVWEKKEILIHPGLMAMPEGQARFVLARALFRHLSGLDQLETRTRNLGQLSTIADRAAAHCEWMGHNWEPWRIEGSRDLVCARPGALAPEEVQVALEDLYWQTQDQTYLRFAKLLTMGSWCPAEEFDADLFAANFCDPIDATYGVLCSEPDSEKIFRHSQRSGITAVLAQLGRRPRLSLRIQNLWLNTHEELQTRVFRHG